MKTFWYKLRAVAGFRAKNTPTDEKIATLQTDMDWVKRFMWVLFAAIFVSKYLPFP